MKNLLLVSLIFLCIAGEARSFRALYTARKWSRVNSLTASVLGSSGEHGSIKEESGGIIKVSSSAAEKIASFIKSEPSKQIMRIGILPGGGCNRMSYKMVINRWLVP